jgi:hypothetical protein
MERSSKVSNVINSSDIGIMPESGAQVVAQIRNIKFKPSKKGHLMFQVVLEVAQGDSAGFTIFDYWMVVHKDNPATSVKWFRKAARTFETVKAPDFAGEFLLERGVPIADTNKELIKHVVGNNVLIEGEVESDPEHGESYRVKRYIEFVPAEEVEGGFDEVGFLASEFVADGYGGEKFVEEDDLL